MCLKTNQHGGGSSILQWSNHCNLTVICLSVFQYKGGSSIFLFNTRGGWRILAIPLESRLKTDWLPCSVLSSTLITTSRATRLRYAEGFGEASRKYSPKRPGFIHAAGLGLEPRFLGPKPSVLPLDDPAIYSHYNDLRQYFYPSLAVISITASSSGRCGMAA